MFESRATRASSSSSDIATRWASATSSRRFSPERPRNSPDELPRHCRRPACSRRCRRCLAGVRCAVRRAGMQARLARCSRRRISSACQRLYSDELQAAVRAHARAAAPGALANTPRTSTPRGAGDSSRGRRRQAGARAAVRPHGPAFQSSRIPRGWWRWRCAGRRAWASTSRNSARTRRSLWPSAISRRRGRATARAAARSAAARGSYGCGP